MSVFLEASLKQALDNQAREIYATPLYKALDASSVKIYIHLNNLKSDTSVRTDLNKDTFEDMLPGQFKNQNFRYIIAIHDDVVNKGYLALDQENLLAHFPTQSEQMVSIYLERKPLLPTLPPELQPFKKIYDVKSTHEDIAPKKPEPYLEPKLSPQMMQPVDFLPFTSPLGQQKPPPFIHIDESDSLLNRSFVDGPGRVNQLSLYTVLLHELGHVMQYLESASPFSQGKDVEEITVKSLPTIPANLILRTQKALENQDPRASIWPQLTDLNRVVQVWLTVVEDALTQNDLLGRVDKAKKIGEKISAQAQVWLEYDVITNVEHPEAQNRGEAIRHIHGAEAKVEDPDLKHFDVAKKSIQDLSAKNIQSDPKSFPDLHRLMYGNAFLLTQHLPDLLKEFLGLVETLKQNVIGKQ